MLVPSTLLLFSSYSKQLLSINNPSTFFSLLLTLSTALHPCFLNSSSLFLLLPLLCIPFPSTLLLSSSYSKKLLCILVSSTLLLSSSYSKQLLYIFVPSILLLFSSFSKHLFCILVLSTLLLSSIFKQQHCILVPSPPLLSSCFKQLLCILFNQLFFSLLTPSNYSHHCSLNSFSLFDL